MQIHVSPVQWSSLRDIDQVEPLGERDAPCLSEIRDVLQRHGMLDRFGVALLHSHFPMAQDEVLLETTDKTSRTLTLSPAPKESAAASSIGTIWRLSDEGSETMAYCELYCRRWGVVGHDKGHAKKK